jgi:hypothetical protein
MYVMALASRLQHKIVLLNNALNLLPYYVEKDYNSVIRHVTIRYTTRK